MLKSFLFASTLSLVTPVMAQATFLIWPIYPKIEANEKATAVWLQNTGKTDAMVQIRVFKWNQDGLKDNYSEQSEIIPSPPVAKIKAGEKHMLRLTKSANLPDGKEQSYRLI
ncbi:molecular chaperone, partial [Acinetobacter baumannii]